MTGPRFTPGRRGFWARFFAGLPDAPAGGYDYHGTPRPTPGSWLLSRFHEHAAALTRAFVTVPFAAACPSCGGVMPLDPHDFETLRLTRAEGESAVAATCAACNETGVVALSEARPALRLGLTVVTRRLRDVEVVEPAAARIDRAAFVPPAARHPCPDRVLFGGGLDAAQAADLLRDRGLVGVLSLEVAWLGAEARASLPWYRRWFAGAPLRWHVTWGRRP